MKEEFRDMKNIMRSSNMYLIKIAESHNRENERENNIEEIFSRTEKNMSPLNEETQCTPEKINSKNKSFITALGVSHCYELNCVLQNKRAGKSRFIVFLYGKKRHYNNTR